MASQPRILFVDDEPLVLEGIRRALRGRAAAWSMTFMNDPVAALREFQVEPFDIVVSDLAMPGLSGIELVIKMRAHSENCAFIMLTGTADLPQAVAAINQARVFRFFTKPCDASLLAEGIEAGLSSMRDMSKQTLPALTASLGLAALNRVAFGVMVVDANTKVLLANRSCGELLSERDGLYMDTNGVLRTSSAKETEKLHSLVRAAITPRNEEAHAGMSIERPSLKRPLTLLTCAAGDTAGKATSALAVIFVGDPDQQSLPDAAAIARIFGLTLSEAKLAHALTQGLRIEEAAKVCGVTHSTARTYLKQIFLKTETNRQPELVKLILTSPALAA